MIKGRTLTGIVSLAASVAVIGGLGVAGLSYVAGELHDARMQRAIRTANTRLHIPESGDFLDKYWRCEAGMHSGLRWEYLRRLREIPYNTRPLPVLGGTADSVTPFTPPDTIRAGVPLLLPDVDGDGAVGCAQYTRGSAPT